MTKLINPIYDVGGGKSLTSLTSKGFLLIGGGLL